MGFYRYLSYISFPWGHYSFLLVSIFKLFKKMQRILKLRYIVIPLSLRHRAYLPLDRSPKDFDEALLFAYFADGYERLGPGLKKARYQIVVDVGAHYGFFTLKMSNKAEKIIAVEPAIRNLHILYNNVRLNKLHNVIIIPVACWSSQGFALMEGETDEMLRIVKAHGLGNSKIMEKAVRLARLEDVLKTLGVAKVDLLKMDVEGAEEECLKGLGAFLDRVQNIVLEVHGIKLLSKVRRILHSNYSIKIYRISDNDFIVYGRARSC